VPKQNALVSPRVKSWFQTAAGGLTAALLVVVLRLTWDAHKYASYGEQQAANHAYPEACAAFMDAARMYYPGNPYANLAFARLLELADAAATLGPVVAPDLERRALEAFRIAALATRSTYVPHAAELEKVNERLAGIYARWELDAKGAYKSAPGVPSASYQQRQQWHLEKLRGVPGPSWLWSSAGLFGLAIAIGAVVLFIAKALTPALKLQRGPALGAGLAFVLGFTLFLLGITR
jgi:hypothetical protein